MKLALIGFGVMGQLVAVEARKAGDEIGAVLTSKDDDLSVNQLAEKLRGHDVAVDFSIGEAVLKNVEGCARARVPLVEGATGWFDTNTPVTTGGSLVVDLTVMSNLTAQPMPILHLTDLYVRYADLGWQAVQGHFPPALDFAILAAWTLGFLALGRYAFRRPAVRTA